MIDKNEILDVMISWVADKLQVEKTTISPQDHHASLGIDSVDFMRLLGELESKYSIQFDTEELWELETIEDIANVAVELSQDGQAPAEPTSFEGEI